MIVTEQEHILTIAILLFSNGSHH